MERPWDPFKLSIEAMIQFQVRREEDERRNEDFGESKNRAEKDRMAMAAVGLETFKIRYFLTVKYFMKYFGDVYVFNEIFQNAMPLYMPRLFLPHWSLTQN